MQTHYKSIVVPLILLLSLVFPHILVAADKVPNEVGGFSLGSDISDYPDVVDTNYLKETVITDWHGFRKGIISYGICKYNNKILKIQLKYEDSSKKYFQKLLAEYKKKFGAPNEWKGDSFGILHIWKWYFVDEQERNVSLILQHNLRNPNENLGNMVKLSFPKLLNEERACFNEMCEQMKSDKDKQRLEDLKKPDWQYLIPR